MTEPPGDGRALPVAIATWRWGELCMAAGGPILARGGASLDAVEAGINAVEDAPDVLTVGFGGLPNAEGDVELDALIMSGTIQEAGAVAALRDFPRPISVARAVMERSPHTFLVGPGAGAFARGAGFAPRDLLTPHARERWEAWRRDPSRRIGPVHDTVGMVALDSDGAIAAGCSTSGLPFKAPGRVGDSPAIGAGAWCDDSVGGAAATGNGDVMMRFCLSYAAVEGMRAGLEPAAACEAALRRVLALGVRCEAALIALDRSGAVGAAAIGRAEFPHAVWTRDGAEMRRIPGMRASP